MVARSISFNKRKLGAEAQKLSHSQRGSVVLTQSVRNRDDLLSLRIKKKKKKTGPVFVRIYFATDLARLPMASAKGDNFCANKNGSAAQHVSALPVLAPTRQRGMWRQGKRKVRFEKGPETARKHTSRNIVSQTTQICGVPAMMRREMRCNKKGVASHIYFSMREISHSFLPLPQSSFG